MVFASATGQSRDIFVTLGGVRMPLQVGPGGPSPVQGTPTQAFADSVQLGDSSRVADQRTAAVLMGDWRGGMGEYRYPAGQGAEGYTSFQDSDCDTRYTQALICRPFLDLSPAVIGTPTPATPLYPPWYIEHVGPTKARWIAWTPTTQTNASATAWRYDVGVGGGWFALEASTTQTWGFCQFNGAYVYSRTIGGVTSLAYSTDGQTWTPMARTGTGAKLCCAHDGKVYYLNTSASPIVAEFSTDLTSTTAYSQTLAIPLIPDENPVQLFEWRNAYGRRAVYLLTSRRLLGLDDDSLTWTTFYNFPRNAQTAAEIPASQRWSARPRAHVWQRDDNLYLTFFGMSSDGSSADTVVQFTGSEINVVGPNRKGGLPPANRFACIDLVGSLHWLYGAALARGGNTSGRAIAMNATGGWSTLYRNTAATSSYGVVGAGYGAGTLAVLSGEDGQVRDLTVPDTADLPQFTTTLQYDTTISQAHTTAVLDGDTPNIPLQLLSIEVHAVLASNQRALGLATPCSVAVAYNTDLQPAWQSLGTLTSASAFPARLAINGGLGVKCNNFQVQLTLSTTDTTQTPIVTDVIASFVRLPQAREAFTFTLDLREENPVFARDQGFGGDFFGKRATDLRKLLHQYAGLDASNGWRPEVVAFKYGGGPLGNGPNLHNLAAAQVRFRAIEDALGGDGLYQVTVLDVTTPASG